MSLLKTRISTGIASLDNLLGGGFHANAINFIFGEATTGKTTLALTSVFHHLKLQPRAYAIYLDIDNKLNIARFEQIAQSQGKNLIHRIRFFTPASFSMQSDTFEKMPELSNSDLLVVDSITGLYRGETEDFEKTFRANKELNRQLGYLTEIAKTTGSTMLLTGQVRSKIDTQQVEPVAQRLLRYWSEIILRLEKTPQQGKRQAILEKPEEHKAPIILTISESGFTEEAR